VGKPLKLKDTLLDKQCEVISPLFTGRHHKDLFVNVIPQCPQHKGSSNPALTKSPKRCYLKTFGAVLKILSNG
jgi:hypothetical protein